MSIVAGRKTDLGRAAKGNSISRGRRPTSADPTALSIDRVLWGTLLAVLTWSPTSALAEQQPALESVQVGPSESVLGAETRVAVSGTQDDAAFFMTDVMPLIDRLGCSAAACHGSATGQGGLKLSLFGADPDDDYAALTRMTGGRRIDRIEPTRSLLLLKTTAAIGHQGGQQLEAGSPEYEMLVSWIARGAPQRDASRPELVAVEVIPDRRTLARGETQRLLATAVFSDGARRDVTRQARYRSSDADVASVGEGGKVRATGYGQTTIVVAYMRRFDTVRIMCPQPLPTAFPDVETSNKIDQFVLAKLRELGIPPSELCSDHEFLRRAYLDVIGTLPTAEEARAFLSDSDPQRRSRLIDGLLRREESADYWALKWGDLLRIKSEYPSNLWPNAVQAYHRWVRDSIARNKPYDQFARELLTSSGSNFRSPAANYFRAVPKTDPQMIAEATALVFMGARIGCARCHGHPQERWTSDDNAGLAAFFAKVRYKPTQEWKEEIVYTDPKRTMRHPRTNELVRPKFFDGEELELPQEEDPRRRLADWLTAPDNPWFARNVVNRVWYWLLGRGIVHEPDDLRATNPPTDPELLAYLEAELINGQYDLRHIYRLILNSRTYQLSSTSTPWNEKDVAHFSHYPAKRLGAETLLDAIGQVTETSERYQSRIPEPFVELPDGFRATHLADGSIGVPFLELFGRPPRDTAYESDRDQQTSMRQVLHMLNSTHVQGKLDNSPRLRRLVRELKDDGQLIEEVYLSTLTRLPDDRERQVVEEYLRERKNARAQAVQDLVWAIFNTKEFLFNH